MREGKQGVGRKVGFGHALLDGDVGLAGEEHQLVLHVHGDGRGAAGRQGQHVQGEGLKTEGCRLKAEGCRLRAEGCRLRAEGCRLMAGGCRLRL